MESGEIVLGYLRRYGSAQAYFLYVSEAFRGGVIGSAIEIPQGLNNLYVL